MPCYDFWCTTLLMCSSDMLSLTFKKRWMDTNLVHFCAGTYSHFRWKEIWWKADWSVQKTLEPCWCLTSSRVGVYKLLHFALSEGLYFDFDSVLRMYYFINGFASFTHSGNWWLWWCSRQGLFENAQILAISGEGTGEDHGAPLQTPVCFFLLCSFASFLVKRLHSELTVWNP